MVSMMNPYKGARLNLGLTQNQLAKLCHVTTQVVTNLEAGLYYKPPISITNYLSSYDNFNLLDREYKHWIKLTRLSHSAWFADRPVGEGWYAFRGPSQRGFCRQACYQPSMLQEYERFKRNRLSLNYALKDCGVSRDSRTQLLYRPRILKPTQLSFSREVSPVGK